MMLEENYHIIPILSDLDIDAGGATMDGDSINMEGFHSCCFICNMQTIATQNFTIRLYSGATDAALASALTFNYAWASAAAAAANCDVLAAWTSANSVVVDVGVYDNYILILEIEAAAMDLATGGGEEWLTFNVQDDIIAGATGNLSVHAVLTPRYKENVHVTALT